VWTSGFLLHQLIEEEQELWIAAGWRLPIDVHDRDSLGREVVGKGGKSDVDGAQFAGPEAVAGGRNLGPKLGA
jgi:hypothetical protein